MTLGDISVRYVNLLLEFLTQQGLSTTELKTQYQLSDTLLSQPEGRISIPRFMRFGHDCIQLSRSPHMGLQVAGLAQPSLLGLAGLSAACAPSLGQALADIAHDEPLSSKNVRGHSRFYREQSRGVAEFYSLSPYNQYNSFIVDMALAVQLILARRLTGQRLTPVAVDIEFPAPSYANLYAEVFECPVRFEQPRNALTLRAEDLSRPLRQSNRVAYAECRQLCDQQLARISRSLSFLDQVADAISPLLHTPDLTIQAVAVRLDLPVWTLQRKLKQQGTTFTQLLDNTRRELALIYLRDEGYTIGEIAYLLGFTYPNAFQRAFKRWTGEAPGDYRRRKARNDSSEAY
ncbi:probable transcriptional regulator [Reinekea sp. MED297]|uniref:Probable transcriptional regulator n=2 Tax=Reinekea TaxID=230494 RepID=A4BJE6_9GAMM|nr:probable transcriptional regulator [Reinekea sp. MED297] [Reinekea blandensis MED297]